MVMRLYFIGWCLPHCSNFDLGGWRFSLLEVLYADRHRKGVSPHLAFFCVTRDPSLIPGKSGGEACCHRRPLAWAEECLRADILVAAIGRPAFVTPDFVAPHAVVIDVGINRIRERAAVEAIFEGDAGRLADLEAKGSVVVGDVHPAAFRKCEAYTPVPRGVGPLTIGMLMSNTVQSAEQRLGIFGD